MTGQRRCTGVLRVFLRLLASRLFFAGDFHWNRVAFAFSPGSEAGLRQESEAWRLALGRGVK
ncbi:MAG: hypothetical protein DMG39_10295 [Acidobacteria bacterium]|nr:MAG: hypothetical protein DMG39_10295 [Acidobacteriota bacterium]